MPQAKTDETFWTKSDARFSPCRVWRYELSRVWDDSKPYLNVIGLNPSTADETLNDPTIKRCINRAHDWGYGALQMTNIFAYRATDPRKMKAHVKPIGAENDEALKRIAAGAGLVLAAWGNHGAHQGRSEYVLELLSNVCEVHCLRVTKAGQPEHPLYLPGALMPQLYRERCYA